MRLNVLLPALLVAGVLIGAAWWFAPRAQKSRQASEPAQIYRPSTATNVLPSLRQEPPVAAPRNAVHSAHSLESNASASILIDLESPDKAVRQDALMRAKSSGDASLIPRLRDLADHTDDSQEKAEFQDAIDFLSLPSIEDTVAQGKAARAAAGLPDVPQSPTNRWTGRPFATNR